MKKISLEYLNNLISDESTKKEIDIIDYIKKCVREYKIEEKVKNCEWEKYFDKLYSLYPRKVAKQNAKKIFEHKIRGLSEEDCRTKCNLIYKAQMKYQHLISETNTDTQYIKHYASWLNAEIPNSPHYKGR